MNALHNIKLGVKLIGGFVSVALIIVAVVVTGYVNLKSVNEGMTRMYSDNLLPIEHVSNAEVAILNLRGDALHFILVPEDRSLKEKDMAADIDTVNQEMNLYRATSLSAEQKDELAVFNSTWDGYQAAIADVVTQVKAGNEQAGVQSMRSGGAGSNSRKAVMAAA